MNLLRIAEEIAYCAHAKQADKANRPYMDHVLEVVSYVDSEDEKIVAFLHDVIEDHPEFGRLVMNIFPARICHAVHLLNRSLHPEYHYYSAIKQNELALKVKLADIKSNSNPERLAMLDEKTANRLKTKYENALIYLS